VDDTGWLSLLVVTPRQPLGDCHLLIDLCEACGDGVHLRAVIAKVERPTFEQI